MHMETTKQVSGGAETAAGPAPEVSQFLYSYEDARRMLGNVPVSTFAKWVGDGLVATVRIGPRRQFVPAEEVQRLRREGTPGVPKAKSRPRASVADPLPQAG